MGGLQHGLTGHEFEQVLNCGVGEDSVCCPSREMMDIFGNCNVPFSLDWRGYLFIYSLLCPRNTLRWQRFVALEKTMMLGKTEGRRRSR